MPIYLDTITLTLALVTLLLYSKWLFERLSLTNIVGFIAIVSYLFAQTGWTIAFFQGDEWGRDFNNYIWFIFNTCALVFLTLVVMRRNAVTKEKKHDD